MSSELISVIIPVYNVRVYLRECVASVLGQTYGNLEILLVDDGSTDGSGALCDLLAEEDCRIRVFHHEKNAGLSASRNTGLEHISGDYLCFVDSDDVVSRDYVQMLYRNMQSMDADLSMCSYVKFRGDIPPMAGEVNRPGEISRLQILEGIASFGEGNESEKFVVTWNKLFKRELFRGLRFPKKWHEDEFMIQEYLLRAGRIIWTDARLYGYRQRQDSIMGESNRLDYRHMDMLEAKRRRIRTFSGREYRGVFPRLILSYVQETNWMYLSMWDAGHSAELKRRMLLPLLLVLTRYAGRTGFAGFIRYIRWWRGLWCYRGRKLDEEGQQRHG